MINVRYGNENDIPICGEFWKALVQEEYPFTNPDVTTWCSQFGNTIKNERNRVFIGEYDGKIVGFLSGMWFKDLGFGDKVGMGEFFYILPEYRKKGVGKAIHEKYKTVCKELGLSRVVRQIKPEKAQYLVDKGQKIISVIIEQEIGG
jgi:GNAT superfamily N-acetyltransferase